MDQGGSMVVLGGSGFLGARVVSAAAAAGFSVVSASRDPGLRGAPSVGARAESADALRAGELEALLARERPRQVVLCTALSRGADCDRYPALARALNVELPQRVGRWCAQTEARLVHVSTDLVFGARRPPPGGFAEDDAPAPLSLYGETKALGERALAQACPAALVVRLPLLYGDSLGRGLGASDSLLAALERGETPLLFEDEWRTPLDVGDAAAALVELSGGTLAGLLHVGGPARVSRLELGRWVLKGAQAEPLAATLRAGRRADAGLEATRPEDASLDSSRARAILRTRLRAPAEALGAT